MWLILILAGLFTFFVGIVIGLPTLRLRGDYLAIVTLGFGEIVPQFVRNGDSLGGFDLTHGTYGIAPIDSLGFGSFAFRTATNGDASTTGPASGSSCSRSSAACACATRGSVGPGSRSARTRRPPPRWASR